MLKSHNLQDLELDFFTSFLDRAIKGEEQYVDLVTPIILDAASLAKGEKQLYQLDRIGLNVKILLIEKASTLLSSINSTNLSQNFESILEAINGNRLVAFV
ncbi:MAG: hypothetical protein ACTHNW_07880 [Mucilaginibacter sp.]